MSKILKILYLVIVVTVVAYIVVKHPEQARIRTPLLAGDIPLPTYLLIFISFFFGTGFATLLYGKTIWQLRRKIKKAGLNHQDDHLLAPTKDIAID